MVTLPQVGEAIRRTIRELDFLVELRVLPLAVVAETIPEELVFETRRALDLLAAVSPQDGAVILLFCIICKPFYLQVIS